MNNNYYALSQDCGKTKQVSAHEVLHLDSQIAMPLFLW